MPALPQNDHDLLVEIHTKMNLLITNGGSKGAIPDLQRVVIKHEKQLNLWRGAIGVLTFLLILIGGTEIWHVLAVAKVAVR